MLTITRALWRKQNLHKTFSARAAAWWAKSAAQRATRKAEREKLRLLRRQQRAENSRRSFVLRNREQALAAYRDGGYERRLGKELDKFYRHALARRAADCNGFFKAIIKLERKLQRRGDPVIIKLRKKLRRYFEKAFASGSKSKRSQELIGCTIAHLRQHLERHFKPGMTWDNHSFEGWHIDHIRPLATFDLSDPEQCRQAFHFTNLQPLWGKENLTKGARCATLNHERKKENQKAQRGQAAPR